VVLNYLEMPGPSLSTAWNLMFPQTGHLKLLYVLDCFRESQQIVLTGADPEERFRPKRSSPHGYPIWDIQVKPIQDSQCPTAKVHCKKRNELGKQGKGKRTGKRGESGFGDCPNLLKPRGSALLARFAKAVGRL